MLYLLPVVLRDVSCTRGRMLRRVMYCVLYHALYSVLFRMLQVVEMVSPPYTQDFVNVFYPLISNEDLTRSIRADSADDPASRFISKSTNLSDSVSAVMLALYAGSRSEC